MPVIKQKYEQQSAAGTKTSHNQLILKPPTEEEMNKNMDKMAIRKKKELTSDHGSDSGSNGKGNGKESPVSISYWFF